MSSEVDLLIVVHNSRRWIPGLAREPAPGFHSRHSLFLDNASSDETPDLLAADVQTLPFRAMSLRPFTTTGLRGV